MKLDCSETKRHRLPTQVLVYCFRRNEGAIEYLMLRRTAKLGGFWQGVTGAPEEAETLLAAASRELFEETQLAPRTILQVDFSYSFPPEDEWKSAYAPGVTSIDEHVFLAEIEKTGEPTLSYEHDQFQWVGFECGMDLLKWDNNRKALDYCDRLLRGMSP
jgi:8-oxo-dGTP pyrophosphatase MutT (NUDIX family)